MELLLCCTRSLHAGTRAFSWCQCKRLSPRPGAKVVRIWSAAADFNQKCTSSLHRAVKHYWCSHRFLLDVSTYLQNFKTFGPNAVKAFSYGYRPGMGVVLDIVFLSSWLTRQIINNTVFINLGLRLFPALLPKCFLFCCVFGEKCKLLMGYENSHLCWISLRSFVSQVVVIAMLSLVNYNKPPRNS